MAGMSPGLEGRRTLHDTSVFEKSVLSNGVTIWLQKPPIQLSRRGVIVACLPNVGSLCDPPDMPGTAHFFEHAPFLGTTRRPTYNAVFAPIEDLSGDLNAATSKIFIRYYCALSQDQFRLAAETIYEIAAQPLIRDEDIITERGTILAEWRRRQANGDVVANEATNKQFWGDGPMSNPIIGYPESISAMTAEHLRAFFDRHFVSENLHLVVGGAFAGENVLPIIEDLFGSLPKKSANPRPKISMPSWQGKRASLVDPNFRRDRIQLSWVLDGDVDLAASRITNYLAGDMTSPLIATFRRGMGAIYERGWATSFYSSTIKKTGINFTVPINAEHFSFAENAVYEELGKITPGQIVREQKIDQYQRDHKCPHPITMAVEAVEDLVDCGRIRSVWEMEEESDTLTVEQVIAVRDQLLTTRPFICATRAS